MIITSFARDPCGLLSPGTTGEMSSMEFIRVGIRCGLEDEIVSRVGRLLIAFFLASVCVAVRGIHRLLGSWCLKLESIESDHGLSESEVTRS